MAVCSGVVILIAGGLYNIIARIFLLKTVFIWRGVGASDGAAGGRSEGQGLVFFLSYSHFLGKTTVQFPIVWEILQKVSNCNDGNAKTNTFV